MWVFDATPLIYLAKVDHLDTVQELADSCAIPDPVHDEVVITGVEEGYPDARQIQRSIEASLFEVVTVESSPLLSRLQENDNLSEADRAVLAYAATYDGTAVMDEQYGRDVAASEGITTRGTAYLVLTLAKDGALDVDEARDVIDEMIDAGWYCAPDLYSKIVQRLESFAE